MAAAAGKLQEMLSGIRFLDSSKYTHGCVFTLSLSYYSGGGGGAAAAAEEEKEEEEEEEADLGGGMDMFGGDGDGGDY